MLINKLNYMLPTSSNNSVKYINNTIKCDTFEKSTNQISFKGSDGVIFEPYTLIENMYVKDFFSITEGLLHNKQILKKIEQACPKFTDYVGVCAQNPMTRKHYYNAVEKHVIGNGINSHHAFYLFMNSYMQRDKNIFNYCPIDYVRIYGCLDDKSDLNKFPDILAYLYNENTLSDEKKAFNPNPVINFLKSAGISNSSEFEEHFKTVSTQFNNFQSMTDVIEGISYLQKTYPFKIDFIRDAVKDSPFYNSSTTPEKIYSKNNDIIDYLYEANNGENLEPLPEIKNVFLLYDKIKLSDLKPIADSFNNFETHADKVDFMYLLASNNISVAEYNKLPKRSVFEDEMPNENLVNIVSNKEMILDKISVAEELSEHKAAEKYLQYAQLYNALCKNDSGDNARIKSFSNLVNKFGLTNSQSVLSLYNNINQTDKKQLKKEEFEEFVDLMNYCDSKDVFKAAKKEGVKPADIIKRDKEQFLSVEKSIVEFIEQDDSVIFAGKTPTDIYFQYKKAINASPENITEILRNIVNFDINNSADYQKKLAKAQILKQYFDSEDKFKKFVNANNLHFNSSEEDEKRLQICVGTLSFVQNNIPDKLEYYTGTDFISKSLIQLKDFYEEHPSDEEQKQLFSLFADKEVPSVDEFKKYLKKYKDNKGGTDNIIKKLKELPSEINFNAYTRYLALLNNRINGLELPFRINNSNIMNISDEQLKNSYDYNSENICPLLNSMFKSNNSNFMMKLPKAVMKSIKKYDKYSIANEIAIEAGKNEESYRNIIAKLGIKKSEINRTNTKNEVDFTQKIYNNLPDEFVSVINSAAWQNVSSEDKKVYNISMHAKLRLIDRFLLNDDISLDKINTEETQNKLSDILKAVYFEKPQAVYGKKGKDKIVVLTPYKSDVIKSVFGTDGKLVTIVKKD